MTNLIIIRGISGSGKSTLARQLLAADPRTVWFEADQYFTDADGNYNWSADKLHAAHQWCQTEVQSCLARGMTVLVSNTFTTKKELRPYFDYIQRYGKNPTVICMQSSYKNVHNVPQATLDAMKHRFVYDISDMFLPS